MPFRSTTTPHPDRENIMGRTQAEGFAAEVREGLALSAALHYHLTANHYPPVPTSMVQPCIDAIEAVNDGFWGREIDLPEGVTFQGEQTAPAHEIVTSHHLHPFLRDDARE
jgi:hypothetical protein